MHEWDNWCLEKFKFHLKGSGYKTKDACFKVGVGVFINGWD